MTAPPQLIFVEQYYFPEGWGGAQIPRDITIDLAKMGYPVSVICGRDQYVPVGSDWHNDSNQDPRTHGVSIWYVPQIPLFKRRTKSLLSQVWFSLFAVVFVIVHGRRSILIVQTNPPLIVVAAGAMAVLLGRPVVLVAQDIYPEVMIAHGMIKRESKLAKLLIAMFRWAYRRATYVVSLGPTMTTRLKEKGVARFKVREISNWATGDLRLVRGPLNRFRAEWGLSDKFVLLYSGNLGVAHDAETVLRAVAAARASLPRLRLVIVGEGSRIAEAQRIVRSLSLDDRVLFRPFVSDDLLPLSLGVADMALVTLLPGFEGLVVPSKLLGQMARGIPTLYVGPKNSDVAELISKSLGGISVANGEWDYLANQLIGLAADQAGLEQMGASAMKYYTRHLAREIGLDNYRSVIASVANHEYSS